MPRRKKMHVVKGSGFNSRVGGFASIIIDGKEYDAQRIAAFPKMLKALKTVRPSIRRAYREDCDWWGDLEIVNAAIAKAEGRS